MRKRGVEPRRPNEPPVSRSHPLTPREEARHDAPTVPFRHASLDEELPLGREDATPVRPHPAALEPGVSRRAPRRDLTPSIEEFAEDAGFEPGVSRRPSRDDLTPSIEEFAGDAVPSRDGARAPRRPPLDPRRAGGQSFFAERVRVPLDALERAPSEVPPPEPPSRVGRAVHELATVGPDEEGPLVDRVLALGPAALPAIGRAFPGKTWVDFDRPHRPLRSSAPLSALCRALVAFGPEAVPQVITLLRSPKRDVRAAACLVAADLVEDELVRPLLARLHDDEHRVRVSALQGLRAAAALPAFTALRTELFNTLGDDGKDVGVRARAAKTLGELREAEAVPRLIEELGGPPEVARAARDALLRIVGQDRGRFRFSWRRWWRQHGAEARRDWLIAALDQKDATQRLRVANELILLTGRGWDRKEEAETREGARALMAFYGDG